MTWHPSLGDSAFVDLARKVVLSTFTKDLWDEVGGPGQVQARFKSAVQVGARLLGQDAKFHVSLFVNRPVRNTAHVSLAVRLEPLRGATKEESYALRDEVAEDLRRALRESSLSQHAATQSTVASTGVPVNAGEADTARAAEAVLGRLRATLDDFHAAEPVLATWCVERLPKLLERDRKAAQ